MNKSELRKHMLALRNRLTVMQIKTLSDSIASNTFTLSDFKNAKSILIYLNFKSEVITDALIERCYQDQKHAIVPVVDNQTKQLVLVEIDKHTQFELSAYGIREPKITAENIKSITDIDLILAPGVAFDLKGNRIGYGGGYYDKLIQKAIDLKHELQIFALAFELQLTDAIPADSYDKKINGIITEKNIYKF